MPHSLFDLREHCLHRTISISLLFRKGNVCTSKGFFEEEPCHPGSSRLSIPCPSGVCTAWAAVRQSLLRPAPSRRGSSAGGEKTNTWKNTWGFWSRPSEVSFHTQSALPAQGNWDTDDWKPWTTQQQLLRKNCSRNKTHSVKILFCPGNSGAPLSYCRWCQRGWLSYMKGRGRATLQTQFLKLPLGNGAVTNKKQNSQLRSSSLLSPLAHWYGTKRIKKVVLNNYEMFPKSQLCFSQPRTHAHPCPL